MKKIPGGKDLVRGYRGGYLPKSAERLKRAFGKGKFSGLSVPMPWNWA